MLHPILLFERGADKNSPGLKHRLEIILETPDIRMSSVHAYKSQVAPFKRYIVQNGATCQLYDAAGNASGSTLVADVVLRDMGKTVILADGTPLRKVEQVTSVGTPRSGYIYLENVPAAQNIACLN